MERGGAARRSFRRVREGVFANASQVSLVHPGPQSAADKARGSRLGRRAPAQKVRVDGAGLALPAVSEGARYGIELFYPYENELHVSTNGGKLLLEGDFGPPPEDYGGQWPPFRTFGALYYTYQLSLDLKVDQGWAVRTEPHPRFYTDPTDTVPIAVPALIRRWWPMINFLVFKSPPEGRTHIFRPGEPFAQMLVVPEEATFDLVPMPEEEAAERELQSRRIYQSRSMLSAETEWKSATNTVFDGTYRHILGAATEKAKRRP